VRNYIHLLLSRGLLDNDREVAALINRIKEWDVSKHVSLAHLRNSVKDFWLAGKAHLAFSQAADEKVEPRDNFNVFDESEGAQTVRDTLYGTNDRNEFYQQLQRVLAWMLPMNPDQIKSEISRLVDEDLFGSEKREPVLKKTLEEILIRRIGGRAVESVKTHLTARRGAANIPYFRMFSKELEIGTDADEYGYGEFSNSGEDAVIDYEFAFHGREQAEDESEAAILHDATHDLFPFPEDLKNDNPAVRSEVRFNAALSSLLEDSQHELFRLRQAVSAGNHRGALMMSLDLLESLDEKKWRELFISVVSQRGVRLIIHSTEKETPHSFRLHQLSVLNRVRLVKGNARQALRWVRPGDKAVYLADEKLDISSFKGAYLTRGYRFADPRVQNSMALALLYVLSGGQMNFLQDNNGFLEDAAGVYSGLAQELFSHQIVAWSA